MINIENTKGMPHLKIIIHRKCSYAEGVCWGYGFKPGVMQSFAIELIS
jgi:hypothetical protein